MSAYKPNWKRLNQNNIKVAQLDDMMKYVLDSGTGTIGAIIGGIKLAVMLAYLTARRRLVLDEMLSEKQDYIQAVTGNHGNENEVID